MNVLVCIKRIPATGGKITLTADEQEIDTHFLGFTMSPHEECAVEEAVRLIETNGGSSTALALGSEESIEQLRDAMALGIDSAILLKTDGREFDPGATAKAIVDAVLTEQAAGTNFDVLFFGNEAADTGDYQVGIRVAEALDLPCVTGVKALLIQNGKAEARREIGGGAWEIFDVSLPAVFTVKEGINLPRYPSLPGRLKAKKKPIKQIEPARQEAGLEKLRLKLPKEQASEVTILGKGPEAAPKAAELLQKLGIV